MTSRAKPRYYPWDRLTATGKSVIVRQPPRGCRTAANAYAKRHGFAVSCWRTEKGNLVVERVGR